MRSSASLIAALIAALALAVQPAAAVTCELGMAISSGWAEAGGLRADERALQRTAVRSDLSSSGGHLAPGVQRPAVGSNTTLRTPCVRRRCQAHGLALQCLYVKSRVCVMHAPPELPCTGGASLEACASPAQAMRPSSPALS